MKKHRVYKYLPEYADIEVGEFWWVQIEPIAVNTCPRKVEIREVTENTLTLLIDGARNTSTYTHFAVKFLEKVGE